MTKDLTPVRVWDLPTRAFHWVLAVCVVTSIVTARIGGNASVWHFRSGYVVFTLLLFRILWGLVGGHWSRFVNFIYGPAAVLRYLRGASREPAGFEVGHNPLGAFSVFGLLLLLAAQVGTGLFADDEIASAGPLARFASGATSLALTGWHKTGGQWSIIALLLLHVGAILFYLLGRKEDLVRPMLTGDKHLAVAARASLDDSRTRMLAAVLLGACAGLVTWLVSLGA